MILYVYKLNNLNIWKLNKQSWFCYDIHDIQLFNQFQ